MKLRNKRTGEIGTLIVDGAYKFVTNFAVEDDAGSRLGKYDSLVELNEEWEDVLEEPNPLYVIDPDCLNYINRIYKDDAPAQYNRAIEMGLGFEKLEEAEKAVARLKAWKRLKDKGFKIRLRGWKGDSWLEANWGVLKGDYSDVRLLLGGEE